MGDDEHLRPSRRPGTRAAPRLAAEFREPPPEFAGCFTSLYHLTLELPADAPPVTDHLQPEWGNIRFFCGTTPDAHIAGTQVSGAPFVATGPSSQACRFTLGTCRMWGVGFLPLGWARFFAEDASAVTNIICDGAAHPAFTHFAGLTEALCDPGATIAEQYDALVAGLAATMRPNRDEPRIARVHAALVSGEHASVHDLAEACAVSIRTLERICTRYFGFSPKLLMRRQRFMRSLATFMLQRDLRWTEAMDAHYHDQAQFTREFRDFMMMNPSEYAALDHPILTSFMEARAKAWGSAAQTLDPPAPPARP
ncbi:helix-turn-helix domain-containing protein [Erythrobacter colymbi]|uniref:helix-turn-helix domain-containing protein n=1 Tax=Erythrobacter colymbi TaxID=1161202 RepID=UPI000A39682C|nr:helix-turn-helix domain-containing protein [Erythrobacter colymbi]